MIVWGHFSISLVEVENSHSANVCDFKVIILKFCSDYNELANHMCV